MVSYRQPGPRLYLLLDSCFQTFVLIFTVVRNTEDGNCIKTRHCCWNSRGATVTVTICICFCTQATTLHTQSRISFQFWVVYHNLPQSKSSEPWGGTAVFRERLWSFPNLDALMPLTGRRLMSKMHSLFWHLDEDSLFLSKTIWHMTKGELLSFTDAKMHTVKP